MSAPTTTALPTFTRREVNALVAQARGDFAVYSYSCAKGTRYMLHDKSPNGLWSHIEHGDRHQCFDARDKEAAAAPYCSDFMAVAGKGGLLRDLYERNAIDWEAIRGDQPRHCTDSAEHALRVSLFWLKEVCGVRIERAQIVDDRPA